MKEGKKTKLKRIKLMLHRAKPTKYPEQRARLKPIRCRKCGKIFSQGKVVELLVDCPHCGEENYIDNLNSSVKIGSNQASRA